jgi:hypothetical protein
MSVLLYTPLVCLATYVVWDTCRVFACHCDSIPTNRTWARSPFDVPVNTDGLYSQKSHVCLSSIYGLWEHNNSPIIVTS